MFIYHGKEVDVSGLWAEVFKVLDVYEESKYAQNEIIRITGKMRDDKDDDDTQIW